MIISNYTPRKMFEIAKRLQRIFSNVYSQLFLEFALKKIFIISQKASMNFFEGCTRDFFQNIHLEKCSKQPNDFKEFFQMCILDYFQSLYL